LRNLVVAFAGLAFCAVVAAQPAAQDTVTRKTVREAVYTEAQAERGKKVYEANCVTCHLPDLDGSANPDANPAARGAPLVGTRFVQDFGESKVSALFNKMKRDMPSGRPGTLTDQEYLDAASYVLQRNRFPAGAAELTEETAGEFWIPGAGGADGLQNYTFVTTVGCLHQDPTRSWLLNSAQELKKTQPAAGAAPAVVPDSAGEFTFRLLDAISYSPEPHNGHKVRVTGYMVRLGAEIRINVQSLQMVGTSCGK
jgi:mono/diheme cytochrome c family protein